MAHAHGQLAELGGVARPQRLRCDIGAYEVQANQLPGCDNTVVTTMKRESAKSMLADIKATGKHPMTMKLRYTYQGACREGQAAMGMDKDSEQCKKIRESVAKMDPAKSCAGSGSNREQCESMIRQQIAQAKAMCN